MSKTIVKKRYLRKRKKVSGNSAALHANYANFTNSLSNGRSAYSSADNTQDLKYWSPSKNNPDKEISSSINNLRYRSRDLYKNSTFGRSALSTLSNNVIGGGLKLQPAINREYIQKKVNLSDDAIDEIEDEIEFHFNNWAKSKESDAEGKQNFYEIQWLSHLSRLMSGDVFATLPIIERKKFPYKLKVQLIESDRVRNPYGTYDSKDMRMGIKYGDFSYPEKYYIHNDLSINPLNSRLNGNNKNYIEVDAFGKKSGRTNILHLFKAERPGQGRGVPLLSSVIETVKHLSRYKEAESTAAIVRSLYNIFIKSKDPDQFPGGTRHGGSSSDSEEIDDEIILGVGEVFNLKPDEEIFEANPSRPNPAFESFVNALAKEIGMATDIPYEILVKQFMASYSASRAAKIEFYKFVLTERERFSTGFNNPIYEEFLTLLVLEGIINLPGFINNPFLKMAYCNAFWIGPSMGQIDELKEVNASTKRIDNNQSTYTAEISASSGKSFKRVAKTLEKELKIVANLNKIRNSTNNNIEETPAQPEEIPKTNEIDEEE